MTPSIIADSISKKFLINKDSAPYKTLRESISSFSFKSGKKEFWALRDISFRVEPGDTLGIIGANGAGKTTLLKILSKITRPTSGRGYVNGRVASLLEVGTGFHHELTGKENIYLNGVILGLKKKEIDKNLDEIVDFAGISGFLETPIKHYSTGMWARLAFSVAAHLQSDILLIDEVLSVGDAEFQKKSLEKMDSLSGNGRTVVFVSHNMPAVRKLCRKCIYLKDGAILKNGEADEVIDLYLSEHSDRHEGFADLSDVSERKGSQIVKLTRIELRNKDEKITGQFLLQDDMTIHLFFEASEKMNRVKIIVEILDSSGDSISNIHDSDSGFNLSGVEGKNHVSLRINELRLCPGKYTITVTLTSEITGFKHDFYDEIENAVTFIIDNQTVIDRPLIRRYGLLYLTPEWKNHMNKTD